MGQSLGAVVVLQFYPLIYICAAGSPLPDEFVTAVTVPSSKGSDLATGKGEQSTVPCQTERDGEATPLTVEASGRDPVKTTVTGEPSRTLSRAVVGLRWGPLVLLRPRPPVPDHRFATPTVSP